MFLSLQKCILFSSAELHISEQNDLAEPRGEAHGEHPPVGEHSQLAALPI